MRNLLILILSVLLFVASALFFAQNDSNVVISYFSGEQMLQLNWVMVFCLVSGFLLGVFSIIGGLIKTKMQLHHLKNQLQKQEKELNNLRSMPIKEHY